MSEQGMPRMRMEKEGVVGPSNPAGKREILLEGGGERDEDAA